jgi:hypothetical protein
MPASGLALPIRLAPRKRSQIIPLLAFTFAFVVASLLASVISDPDVKVRLNGEVVTQLWVRWLFVALFTFGALSCLVGILAVAAKLLPRSPFFHIVLSSDGVTVRRWFLRQSLAWRDAPEFDTLQVEARAKRGSRINHYTVALRAATPLAGETGSGAYMEEALRISANEYGAESEEQDAALLAAWFNTLRTLALDGKLDAHAAVEVPEAFRGSVRSLQQP